MINFYPTPLQPPNVLNPDLSLKGKRSHPTRTFCLTFHDIIPNRTAQSLWFDCSVSEFKNELDWLTQKGAHFISVDQLYRHLSQKKPLPNHSVCITFADGYLGFYKFAYPFLLRRRIPCTMFVHTGFVGSSTGRPKMTWAQLQEIDKSGVISVGSQTVTHPANLGNLDSFTMNVELQSSKRQIEQHLGHPVPDLAYPNGKFNNECEVAARNAGYRMAFSEELMPAEKSPSLYAVARYVHTKFRRAWKDATQ